MEDNVEVVTIDGKDYAILKEINHSNKTFLYLSNIVDEEDNLIRKLDEKDNNLIVPLESEKEFEIACNLLLKYIVN